VGSPDEEEDGPLARVVYEALGRLASPSAARAMVEAALGASGRARLGDEPSRLASFITGPLYDVVCERLGEEEADALLVDLAPIVERASSVARPPVKPSRPAAPRPVLLVASADPARIEALRSGAPDFSFHQVGDVFDLVQGVERFGAASLTMVVDCRLPTVHPGAMLALGRLVPPRARVILWGAEKLSFTPGTEGWQRLSASADATRVVAAARGGDSKVMTFSLKKPGEGR
jgi:hypothetical protein